MTQPSRLQAHLFAAEAWVRAAGLAMAGVVAFGSLETRRGVAAMAGVTISVTELLAAIAVCVGAVAIVLRRRQAPPTGLGPVRADRLRRLGAVALVVWAVVHLASVLSTPADPGHVLKFALRVTGGVALALTAWQLAAERSFRARVFGGVLVGLGVVTLLGLAERVLGRSFEPFLRIFRDEPTWMLGEQRLATVFYHANTCAAFFELTVPFLVVALATRPLRSVRGVLGVLWLLGTAVLLSLTYSRAGLLAGIMGVLVLALAARRPRLDRKLVFLACAYAAAVLVAYVANPEMRARIGLTERSYRADYEFLAPCAGHPGQHRLVPLRLANRGEWPLSNRQAPGSLLHTWMTPEGSRVGPWRAVPLPPMPTGAVARLEVPVRLPVDPGTYILAIDVARDEVLRVSALGNPMAWLQCEVLPPGGDLAELLSGPIALARPARTDEIIATRRLEIDRPVYWRAALRLFSDRPLLGVGADRFRLEYGAFVPKEAYDPRARAHSIVLETAANLGLTGLVALGLLVLALAGQVRVILRRGWLRASVPSAWHLSLAAAAGLCGLAVHSLVDYFLAYTQIGVVFWPLVGLVLGTAADPAATERAQTARVDGAADAPPPTRAAASDGER